MNTPLDPTHPPANLMDLMFDDDWLQRAVELEDECDCDIEAGLGSHPLLGADLRDYLQTQAQGLNREKLMAFLQSELGDRLGREELEGIVAEVQVRVRERLEGQQLA